MSLDLHLERSCSHCGSSYEHWRHITHNLGKMADAVGLYDPLWHPKENGIDTAKQLIAPLEAGIARLRADPKRFRRLAAKNSWGTYDEFVPWLEELLVACREHPECAVRVST